MCQPPLWCGALREAGEEMQGLLAEIVVLLEPVYLGPDVAVDNIAFLVLETPGNDDQEIAFAYPESLLDLAFDAPCACDAVLAADTDVVCPEHQVSPGKYLPVSVLR